MERFELPNLGALNFLLARAALGGAGHGVADGPDAQGKVFSTALLRMEIRGPGRGWPSGPRGRGVPSPCRMESRRRSPGMSPGGWSSDPEGAEGEGVVLYQTPPVV